MADNSLITKSHLRSAIDATIDVLVTKQDALTGTKGQVVGFDADGKPMAQSILLASDTAFLPYLTFSSPNSFTLAVNDATKHWDGSLEYSTDASSWSVWDGTSTLSSVDNDGKYVLYLRGTGNTVITGNSTNYRWVLTGTDISCIGNIENLLDYATVESGGHPTMANYCYYYMFNGCTSLTQAPALPAITLASYCYYYMFSGCTSLTQAPSLPATTLASYCYYYMFYGCTSLTQAPSLPATTLASSCYYGMFQGCTSLIQAPALPATTLAFYCYQNMFRDCTSLIQAPSLPATTLADYCYQYMFRGCTSLTQAPALPATTLATYCYQYMFYGCTSLIQAPALPATTLASYCYQSMFSNCTSLTQAPALPATTLASYCYRYMFSNCTSLTQAPALPATTLASNSYYSMFQGCTGLKLSSTKTEEYTQEYRIPMSGTGTIATNALTDMFTSTGGTFTGTPEINTAYYLSSDNMVVYDTEVITLNKYVSSMIDSAKPQVIPVTLTTAGWNATTKTQTVTVAGVLADGSNQLVDIGLADHASSQAWAEADIWCDSQSTDSMTFSCETVPTSDINLIIEIKEVTAG